MLRRLEPHHTAETTFQGLTGRERRWPPVWQGEADRLSKMIDAGPHDARDV